MGAMGKRRGRGLYRVRVTVRLRACLSALTMDYK